MKKLDLTGQRFGRLTVVECCGRSKDGQKVYLCRCDCGTEKKVRSGNLRNGNTQSCGCLSAEKTAERSRKRLLVHGGCGTRLYSIWIDMRSRCTWNKAINWHLYGGRGIKVCDEWANNFTAFRDWAMTNGYSDDLQLDRIDNDGNYEPCNCKWSTRIEQGNNRRTCVYVTINGETKTVVEWCRINGIAVNTAFSRIERGWKAEDAVTKSPKKRCVLSKEDVKYIKEHYIPGSKEYGQKSLAKKFCVSCSTIESIIGNKNWRWVK